MDIDKPRHGGRRNPPGGRPPKGHEKICGYVSPEIRKAIEGMAAEKTIGEVLERLVGFYDAGYRHRRLIATTQALILAHRHPGMYKVTELLEDAEKEWQEVNKILLDLGL